MKFPLSILAAGTLIASPLVAGHAQARNPSSQGAPRFIVLCDCASSAKRARIQHAIKNAGGRTVFTYENLGGFAVEPTKAEYLPRLAQKLRHIPGVRTVEPDGEVSTQS